MELHFQNLTEEDSAKIATKLGEKLLPYMFLAFYGGLGAGKTTFVRHLAKALGAEDVSSPTFTIIHEHTDGRLPLYHIDAYRLNSAAELFALGFEDYLDAGGVIAMEWSENISEAIPAEHLAIHIDGNGSEKRAITLRAHGACYEQLLKEVAK